LHGINASNCILSLCSPLDIHSDLFGSYWILCTCKSFIFVSQVLHMDRNDYYGGESASLNLIQVLFTIQDLSLFIIHRFSTTVVSS